MKKIYNHKLKLNQKFFTIRAQEENIHLNSIDKKNTFFIIGESGIGKTYFILNQKENLVELGYDIVYFSCADNYNIDILLDNIIDKFIPVSPKIIKLTNTTRFSIEEKFEIIESILENNKKILVIDDLYKITDSKLNNFVKYFSNSFKNKINSGKLIFLFRKYPTNREELNLNTSKILEFKPLNQEESINFINYLQESNEKSSMEVQNTLAKSSFGNPLLIKMLLYLYSDQKYPIRDISKLQYLTVPEINIFISKNYLENFDLTSLLIIRTFSFLNTEINKKFLKGLFPIKNEELNNIIKNLLDNLIIESIEWNTYKLNPLIKEYVLKTISEEESKKIHLICLQYYSNLDETNDLLVQLEKINHLLCLNAHDSALEILEKLHQNIFDSGYHDRLLDIFNKFPKLPFELDLTRARIYARQSKLKESIEILNTLYNNVDDDEKKLIVMDFHADILDKNNDSKEALLIVEKIFNIISNLSNKKNKINKALIKQITIKSLILKANINLAFVNINETKENLKEILKLSKEISDLNFYNEIQINLLEINARICFVENNFKMALNYRLELASIYEKLNKKTELAITYYSISVIYFHLSDREQSLHYLSLCSQFATLFNFKTLALFYYYRKGSDQFELGNFKEAKESLLLCLNGLNNLGKNIYSTYYAEITIKLITTLRLMENDEEALKYFLDLKNNFQDHNYPYLILEELSFASKRFDIKETEKLILRLLDSIKNYYPFFKIASYKEIIEFYLNIYDMHNAATFLEEIKKIVSEINLPRKKAAFDYIAAKVFLKQNKLDWASKHAKTSLEFFIKENQKYYLAENYILLGLISMKKGNFFDALKYFEEANKIAIEKNYTEFKTQINLYFSIIYIELGKIGVALDYILALRNLALNTNKYVILSCLYKLLLNIFVKDSINAQKIKNELVLNNEEELNKLFSIYYERLNPYEKRYVSELTSNLELEPDYKYVLITKNESTYLSFQEYRTFLNFEKSSFDIVIDATTKKVYSQSEVIDFEHRETLYNLLIFLAQKHGNVFSKENLIEYVWKIKYNPFSHDNTIYTTINRLRDLIEANIEEKNYMIIKNNEKGYYFSSEINFAIINTEYAKEKELNPRQKLALDYLKTNTIITSRLYSTQFNINRVTAFLELDDLVKKNILKKRGQAKNTYYTRPNDKK
jgi:DNA-binding winged helix-turn-helix (wHTH) protein